MIVGFQRLCCHAVHSGGGDGGTDVERRERLHERLHCRELGPQTVPSCIHLSNSSTLQRVVEFPAKLAGKAPH